MPQSASEICPYAADEIGLVESVSAMVQRPDYPCLGAKSVFRRARATIRVYPELAGDGVAQGLLNDVREFAEAVDLDAGFASFVAVFRGPEIKDEAHFEALLWAQLRALHACDDQPWAAGVASDPADPHFSFSVAGHAYFVIGMHDKASRYARRADAPTLVFNPHALFDRLRREGGFPRMRQRIRKRDHDLQGTTNPMVADHGDCSEARQYAGRVVGPNWQAPFRALAQESRGSGEDLLAGAEPQATPQGVGGGLAGAS